MQLTVGKNYILNFSRQILNMNVQSPSSVSTVMTHHSAQPKPVWKKAPPGLQRPSRIATPSGWPSITPRYLTHTLDPALKAAGARVFVTIRLLKKDPSNSLLNGNRSLLLANFHQSESVRNKTSIKMDGKGNGSKN